MSAKKRAEPAGEAVIKPCWYDRGLSLEGAIQADIVLPLIESALDRLDVSILCSVIEEAIFRRNNLPYRTPGFQERYRKRNGMGPL